MVIETKFEDVFSEGDDGSIIISDSAPSVLAEAVEKAKENLLDDDKYIIRAVGSPRRALDFGVEDLTFIQTESATIFAGEQPGMGTKILAVGVSRDGPLTKGQVEETLVSLSAEADLLPEEMAKTRETARALRSIKQAKYFVEYNFKCLSDEIDVLKDTLDESVEGNKELTDKLNVVEVSLHNLLSAVYTFSESVEQSLKSVDVLRTSKHHVQKYEDSVSTAMGLRHYIQHKSTFSVQWMATYNHEEEKFDYNIGVATSEVCDPDLYYPVKDAAGDTHDPLDYYYGDVDEFLIDIEKVGSNIMESTNDTYNDLKTHLQESNIEGSEILKQFLRIKEHSIREILGNSE